MVLIRADAPQLEIARSETVWNERNPAFVRAFEVPLPVSLTEVKFRAVVYSQTSRSNELKKNACLGYGEFTLDRILSKPDGVIERVMKNEAGKSEPKRGRLVICGENIQCPIINHMFSIRFSLAAACNIYQPSRRRKTQKLFYVRSYSSCTCRKTYRVFLFFWFLVTGHLSRHLEWRQR